MHAAIVYVGVIIATGAGPACAAGLLPIEVGEYAQDLSDCGESAAMSWNGKGFVADYVYIDNIVKVEKTGPGIFIATSRTLTKDENTAKSGAVWRANVHALSPTSFTFAQYAAMERKVEAPHTFHKCP